MKVYKKNEHSLFIKPFGVANKLYLSLTVFIYFDLNSPDSPLKEQELWKIVPEQLKPNPVLDVGMPKPRAEFLLSGSCFAPRNTTRQASSVSITVGKTGKELSVFGNRQWGRNAAGMLTITEPAPFSEMPIIWENAFGGKDFKENPAGKGITPVVTDGGKPVVLLPNIENPNNLIGSPAQKPAPAGFLPLDIMHPLRQKKTGTYNDKWLKERWPYFPDDMNYEFFNAASEDQFMDGFFSPGDRIEILNMNPDIQLISSYIPNLRIRCFVTRKEAPKSEAELFIDVPNRIDTLWLFPSIMRGVVLFRGTTEIFDEEYEDVLRIFLATEHVSDQPYSLEYYVEEQKKAMDLSVKIDMTPLNKASKKIGDMLKRMKKIPKDIDNSIRRGLGKAPSMPRTPAESAAGGQKVIQGSFEVLDKLERQSRDLHSKYGHLVRIDLAMFDRMRGRLKTMSGRITDGLKQIETAKASVMKSAEAAVKEGSAKLKTFVPPDILEKSGYSPEKLLPQEKKVNPWHDRGFPFVVQCRRNLEQSPDLQQVLHRLGLDKRSIKNAWLGVNLQEQKALKTLWGLKPKQKDTEEITLPPGLVIPLFNETVLCRIRIFPDGWQKGENIDKSLLIEGSDPCGLFLECLEEESPVVAVGDDLQALIMEEEAGDAFSVASFSDPGAKLTDDAAKAVKETSVFIVVLPAGLKDTDKLWKDWQDAFPDALLKPLPEGRNLFEAQAKGVDIRKWLMTGMPSTFVEKHKITPDIPQDGKPPTAKALTVPIPKIDVRSIIDNASRQINAHLDKKTGGLREMVPGLKADMIAKAREAIVKSGLNPDDVLKLGAPVKAVSPSEAGDAMVKKLNQYLDTSRKNGSLVPEMETKVNKWIVDIKKKTGDAQIKYTQGMQKLEAAKKTVAEKTAAAKAQQMPPEAKAKFKKMGMDPDMMVQRTRQEVIDMHANGESLSQSRISEVDLSGLDLSGIDLSQAQCIKTNFTGSVLNGANLSHVIAKEADFTDCSLNDAILDRGIFIRAKLRKAMMQRTRLKQTIIKDADLTEADMSDAFIYLSVISATPMTKALFKRAKANLSVLSDADASDSDFTEINFDRCVFRRLSLDRSTFARAVLPSTQFMETVGEAVSFRNANMHKSRMSNHTRFPSADISGVVLTQGSLRETDLSESDFTGSRLDEALIEKCVLREANLKAISAKGCRFSKCDLEGATMRFINMLGGSFRKSRLVNADLSEANLYAVDFYKSVMGDTQIDGANIKRTLLTRRMDIIKEEGMIR